MASKGNRPAGGLGSRVVKRTEVRTGQSAVAKNVRAVSQIGQNLGTHVTDRRQIVNPVEQPGYTTIAGVGTVPLGNAKALDVGKGGPGSGRVTTKTGSQGCY
jgi:hypothetical protein